MKDIENHARALLLRARQQGERFVAAAQAEAEEIKRQAHAEGLKEGRAEGVARGREEGIKQGKDQALKEQKAQLTTLCTTLTQTVAALDASRRQIEASAVADVVELAVAIAERVTKQKGLLDPSVAVANVAEALKLVSHASDVRIAVHPTQKAALEKALPLLQMQWPQLKHVELLEDAALSPGGCRVYTTQGQIDGDLDEQMRRIVSDLLPSTDQLASPKPAHLSEQSPHLTDGN